MFEQQRRLFEMMKAENFSTLVLEYDPEANDIHFTLEREWNKKIKWQGNKSKGFLKEAKN